MEDEEFEKLTKRKLGCFSIFMIVFIIFMALLLGGAILVAKTGLIRIPFLTDAFFKPAAPTRVVEIGDINAGDVEARFEDQIFKALEASDGKQIPVDLTFSEAEVTSFIRHALEQEEYKVPFKNAQVVLLDGGIELYGEITGKINGSESMPYHLKGPILLNVFPTLDAEKNIQFEVNKVSVGGLSLPKIIVDSLVENLLGPQIKSLNHEIKSMAEIDLIELSDGEIHLKGSLAAGKAFTIEQVEAPPSEYLAE